MPRGMKQHAFLALGRHNAPTHPANAGVKYAVTPIDNFRQVYYFRDDPGSETHPY